MVLKPQDVLVVLKILSYSSGRPTYSQLATDLAMSASEVHAAVQRAQAAHLLHGPAFQGRPNGAALAEFLIHGMKYAFPPSRGEPTRGVPTSYAAEPLRSLITQGSELPPVWPHPEGSQRGTAFEPLYKTVPSADLRDSSLYEYLVLVDAIREGRARERKLAEKLLTERLRDVHARS